MINYKIQINYKIHIKQKAHRNIIFYSCNSNATRVQLNDLSSRSHFNNYVKEVFLLYFHIKIYVGHVGMSL